MYAEPVLTKWEAFERIESFCYYSYQLGEALNGAYTYSEITFHLMVNKDSHPFRFPGM